MYKYLFRNRWIALAFAIMTLASAVSMVGTSEKKGTIGETMTLLDIEGDAGAGAQSSSYGNGSKSNLQAPAGDVVIGDYVAPGKTADKAELTPPRR